MNLEQKIEAVLFFKGEPVSRKKLGDILEAGMMEINEAIERLKISFEGRGIVLMENENELTLGTAPELSRLFEKMQKEELSKDLSKASLETLSIILYKNGAHRAEIDYIRGVNSSFILRALSVRGLVQKEVDPSDSRKYIYKPTFDVLSFLGVKSVEELPGYRDTIESLNKVSENLDEENKKSEESQSSELEKNENTI
ncbi:MAG TPA: SMC-Scp complex subunit ScpB [Candidatus Paceibacterota bacterium]|nr:SMC-Scp complex subunit ScpB [Candidatus Paceibacterota bacterium]